MHGHSVGFGLACSFLQNYAYSYIYTRACTCDLGYTMQATVQHSIHLLGIKKYFSLHIIQFYYRL